MTLNRIKRLPDLVSPISWMFVAWAVIPSLVLVFDPTFKELAVLLIIDLIAGVAFKPVDHRFFQLFNPDTKPYFMKTDDEFVSRSSTSERVRLLKSFFTFSKRRAQFLYGLSFLKAIPAFLVVVFYWKHEISNLRQLILMLTVSMVNWCYFYGSVYIESHDYLSGEIRRLHEKFDLSSAFREVDIVYSAGESLLHEIMTLVFIFLFTVGIQLAILLHGPMSAAKILKVGFVAVIGISLFSRIWYMNRREIMAPLEKLFSEMRGNPLERYKGPLPLHSLPLLAQFEKTFNLLKERLRERERELSCLVLKEAEKGRLEALGQISALIAHDLSGPLHSARFSALELQDDSSEMRVERFLPRIIANLERGVELIDTLRARLKNQNDSCGATRFLVAHERVLSLLRMQFPEGQLSKVRFETAENLRDLVVGLPSADLIQVLENLYSNAVKNMLDSQISEKKVSVSAEALDSGECRILIQDTGTGLTVERFEEMTGFRFLSETHSFTAVGLGLRLIRRLVELHGGELSLIPTSEGGTVFSLRLRQAIHNTVGYGLPLAKTSERRAYEVE